MATMEVTCYCGECKITAVGEPAMTIACHCDDCRRHCGSIFQAAYLLPADKVTTTGATITKGVSGMSHRQSCAKCGGIAYDDKKHTPFNMVMVPAGLSKDRKFQPSMHIMYGMRIYDCNDGLPKYKDFPKDMGGSDEMIEDDSGGFFEKLFGGVKGGLGKMGDMVPDMPEVAMPEVPGMPDIPGMSKESQFNFKSGLPDCCAANPEYYKVAAEIPNARLIEMTMAPGNTHFEDSCFLAVSWAPCMHSCR